jgi:hypothetical protein
MVPVVAKFEKEADADKYIAIFERAGATNIVKTKDNGGFTVTFNEPTN